MWHLWPAPQGSCQAALWALVSTQFALSWSFRERWALQLAPLQTHHSPASGLPLPTQAQAQHRASLDPAPLPLHPIPLGSTDHLSPLLLW